MAGIHTAAAAFVGSDLNAVQGVLSALREHGFVDAVALTAFEGQFRTALAYWRLTEAGHGELARLRAEG